MNGLRILTAVVLAALVGGCVIEPFAESIPIAAGYSRPIPLPTSPGGGQPILPSAVEHPTPAMTQPVVVATKPAPIVVNAALKQQAGAIVREKLLARYPAIKDNPLNDYLVLVGSALALYVPRTDLDFTFVLLDSSQPFSGALPPATIYVSRGLLKNMEDESELAGVLAREMSHLQSDRIFRAAGLTMAPPSTRPATNPSTRPANPSPMAREIAEKIAPMVLGAGLGEELDRAADADGARLAAQASYAPDGFLRVLMRLKPGTPNTPERARIQALNIETDIVSKAYPNANARLDVRFKSFIERAGK